MRFRFVWIGKTRDEHWRALQDEYLKRLSFFVKCEILEIKDVHPSGGIEIESKRLLEILNQKDFVVLLDVTGKQLSSHKLADEIEKWQLASRKEITFLIGGAEGVSATVADRADIRLSLSFLTFTHEMARVILLEQLYRGFSIIKGLPYQK